MARKKLTAADSLAKLFPNAAVVQVLAVLLLHPKQQFYQREIAGKIPCTLLQVQRALKRIEAAGLVERAREGNRTYYVVSRKHPAYADLKRVLIKTGVSADLRP